MKWRKRTALKVPNLYSMQIFNDVIILRFSWIENYKLNLAAVKLGRPGCLIL